MDSDIVISLELLHLAFSDIDFKQIFIVVHEGMIGLSLRKLAQLFLIG